ncbi:hypothetical protein [Streptosporangium subroseum]|uniref:hypothetical protein n=1 Tax=Streptosporangium subroseum TaxID=106412 RepID=UPI00308EB5AC|nr:hypothetical protein OHB15_21560 [Streptosporangium subroseum]
MSNLADGVFAVALPLPAVQLTDSPLPIAGVAVAAVSMIALKPPWPFAAVLLFGDYGVAEMASSAASR